MNVTTQLYLDALHIIGDKLLKRIKRPTDRDSVSIIIGNVQKLSLVLCELVLTCL